MLLSDLGEYVESGLSLVVIAYFFVKNHIDDLGQRETEVLANGWSVDDDKI